MDSEVELLIDALHEKLVIVRMAEGSSTPEVPYDHGNLRDAQHAKPPRVIWLNPGGRIEPAAVSVAPAEGEDAPPVALAAWQRANLVARIWAPDRGECERLMRQLVTAARLLPIPTQFDFDNAPYTFPTQVEGKWTELGQLIDLTIGVRVPIPAEPTSTTPGLIEVQGSQWRAGQENPIGEDPESPSQEWEVNRWTG